MKTVGIIGGMSWQSTAEYYRQINEGINERLGGLNNADIVMRSVNFGPIAELQRRRRWDEISLTLYHHARDLESVGADCVLIATNTMHKVAPYVQERIDIPLIHIGEATADAIVNDGHQKVALLGTNFTMEGYFYVKKLAEQGIETLIPSESHRDYIHSVIFDELCQGEFNDDSRENFKTIIDDLNQYGAQAVVLGCTEIPLLVKPEDSPIPIYDTTKIHCQAAVEYALGDK